MLEGREGETEILITRRHDERVRDEGEQKAEEMWTESERTLRVKQRLQNQAEHVQMWRRRADFHCAQAARCLQEARRIETLPVDGSRPRGGGIWVHPPTSPNGHDGSGEVA
jgi:hypothetical protein